MIRTDPIETFCSPMLFFLNSFSAGRDSKALFIFSLDVNKLSPRRLETRVSSERSDRYNWQHQETEYPVEDELSESLTSHDT